MVKAKRNDINEQGKEKKPANEMNEINEQGNEYVDHSKTIKLEFINLFKPEIFLSRFTNIFNLIYFPLQIVNKKIVIFVSTLEIICA
jgi:hypothetical protein